MWYVLYDYKLGWGKTNNYVAIQWGLNGDIPVSADYDGNGISQISVWRPSNGSWYIRTSISNSNYYVLQWGLQNDTPFPADYDDDGIVDLAVWRVSGLSYYFVPSSGECPNGSHTHWIGCEVIL
ncbi:MAG: hypothetical protein IPK63_10735 [Candidatus Competibacteraceae bacterium]|nr:hypothetical protein [Candidatus Competibacteraceae bacterium]